MHCIEETEAEKEFPYREREIGGEGETGKYATLAHMYQ